MLMMFAMLLTVSLAFMGAAHNMPPLYYFLLVALQFCAIIEEDWE